MRGTGAMGSVDRVVKYYAVWAPQYGNLAGYADTAAVSSARVISFSRGPYEKQDVTGRCRFGGL